MIALFDLGLGTGTPTRPARAVRGLALVPPLQEPPGPGRPTNAHRLGARVGTVASARIAASVVGRPGRALYVGTDRRALDALRRINDRTRRALASQAELVGSRHLRG